MVGFALTINLQTLKGKQIMAVNLRNDANETINISGGHWAVYLLLAESFGWVPAGTKRPPALPASEAWHGGYSSSDGQIVADEDAKKLAQILHGAVLHAQYPVAIADVIAKVEKSAEDAGHAIPPQMRMAQEHFAKEFSPLLMFLYKGKFVVE